MNPEFFVKINFMPNPALFGDTLEIVVDTSVFMPSMFTILIQEKPSVPGIFKYIDNAALFRLGAPVTITAKVQEPPTMLPRLFNIMDGEITSVEPVFASSGHAQLRIRGYDLGHRLMMGKKTRVFGDGNPIVPTLTDMQIVTKIAAEHKLVPKVDMSGLAGLMYHYVLQYDQSDWEFLWARAQAIGYQVYVKGRFLHFEPAGRERGMPVSLSWQKDLSRFEPRIVGTGMVSKVAASGWDGTKKLEVDGMSMMHMSSTMAMIPGAAIPGSKQAMAGFMERPEDTVVDPSIRTPMIAKKMADARFAVHESSFVRASGEVEGGAPSLVAGTSITIKNVGIRFTGKYYATQARHIFRGGSYKVQFEVSGRNPYTIRHLLLGKEHETNKVFGVVTAVVTNVNDPQMLGRVRVKFPWMPDSKLDSAWARLAVPGGSSGGLLFIPEVNDEVLVAFENGDVSSPYVVGALWSMRSKPPKGVGGVAVVGGKVVQRVIRSRTGHVIVLDDTSGKESITIKDNKGNLIKLDAVKNALEIKTKGDITLDAGANLNLKAKAKILIDGMEFTVQGKTKGLLKAGATQVDMQVATLALKSTKVDVQGQAQTAIQGAQTSVKGTAMVEIQGALVKIN